MRAVVYTAPGVLPTVVDVEDPVCPADGVVVAVAATGVCRSDWHAWRGHEQVALPHVPGHEYAGTVVAVGPEVASRVVGDRVTVPFVLGCGRCELCRTGNSQVCPDQEQPGFTLPGSFAEQVAVPRADANVVGLPDAVSFVAAASLGCRFATAYRAVVAHGRVAADQWVAVHGCGGVGLSGSRTQSLNHDCHELCAHILLGLRKPSSSAPRPGDGSRDRSAERCTKQRNRTWHWSATY